MKYLNMFCRRIAKDLKQKQLLPLKLLFFVHASTLFVLYPYVTIHMRELGISVEETAIMSAVIPVVAIVMPPLAGMLADKIGNFKLLLSVSSSMGGAAALLLLLVPVGRVQVTFPPRAELLVSCQAAGDQLQLLAEAAQYECDPEHPYAYDVEMRVESCGFVCDWILENGSLPLLSSAMSYAVKIRSPSEGATEAFRYPLTSADLPPISVMTDHTSTRILKNNERYKTTVRRISQNKLFFPTENMYKLTCFNSSEDTPDLSCQFGDNETKIQENDFQRFFMAKVVPLKGNSSDKVLRLSQKKEPKSVKRFRIEGLFKIEKSGNMTKQQSDLIDYPKLACFDNFATLEEEVSIEVLLRPPAPSDPEPGPPAVGETALLQGCKPHCLTTTPRHQLCENTKEDIEIDVSLTFWTYLGGRVFIGIIGGTAFAMFEGAVIAILREHEADYGLQRIYGSIGGMISSPLSGLLIDYVSRGKGYTDFRPAFYLYAVLKVISGALMMTINLEFKSPASNLMEDVTTVLKNVEIVALFVAVFVLGTAWGYIESFLFWLLQDLGGSRSLMGITITVGGIAGIPLLVMSGPIIDKIGHANVLFIGFLFYAIRLTGYSLIYDPWMCLIFEALEGVTSSLAFTAAVTYAARLSTTSTDTSVQGLLGGLYYGVGKGTGSLIGGFLMKAVGTRPTYRIFAVASLVTGCVYFCFNRYFIQKRPQVEGNDICKKKVKQIQTNGKTEKMPLKDAKVNKYLENTPIKSDNKDSYQTGKKEVQNNFSVDAKTSILAKDDDNGNCFTGLDNPTFENEEAPSSGIKAKHSVLEMDRVDDNVKQK